MHYSGLVSGPPPSAGGGLASAQREVLVSTGGGATRGERLLSAALDARPLTSVRGLTWRFLLGPNLPGPEAERLRQRSEKGVIVENNRRDFGELLAGCALSVSQAGYNTVCDILRTGCRSVLIPYADLGETEQTFRAARMRQAGLAQMVKEDDLSPAALAAAIDAAMIAESGNVALDLDGAAQSAHLIMGWLAAAQRRPITM
jgi:predicted glycosyltransferase